MLDYRNSWVAGLKVILTQLLMSIILRTRLPVVIRTLKPRIPVVDINNRSKQANQYNENCKKGCEEREKVLLQIVKRCFWTEGVIVGTAGTPRLYMVKDSISVIYHRNTHLKKQNMTLTYLTMINLLMLNSF